MTANILEKAAELFETVTVPASPDWETSRERVMPPLKPHPRPPKNEVHLWLWQLDGPDADSDIHWLSLSQDERQRAEAFRFEKHRRRFVVAHARLRSILASYVGCAPKEIALASGEFGKPHLLTQPDCWRLDFNLSHSEDSAALAVSSGIGLGVDIEYIRPIGEEILPQILSAEEQRLFDTLPLARRSHALFRSWTRKEAGVKALGTGLQTPPTWFEFDLSRGENALLRVGGSAAEARHWQISTFTLPGPCAGAVAARARGWSLVPMTPQSDAAEDGTPLRFTT